MKPKKILMLAVLSGLLTTGAFYIFIQQTGAAETEQPVMTQVVAAAMDIEENTQLTEENLKMIEVRESEMHPSAIRDKSKAVGEYTNASLASGEVLLTQRIEQEEQADMVSKKVAEGYRAVSVSVDYVKSVSNMIEPGDRVDVVLSASEESSEAGPPAEIIFSDVNVLAVGQRMSEKAEGEAAAEYVAVTLEMTQEDAVGVVDASGRGSLQLILSSRLKTAGDIVEGKAEASEMPADEVDEEESQSEEAVDSPDMLVLPERAHVRSGPSLEADVLTVVEAGDSLITKNEEETDVDGRVWMHVETKSGHQGWISSRIIKLENE
ncbi:Flp pilus assembly protein CpaB [Salinicoccus halitifaciens]|uniref:Pilus assembly protein CpaB n=1 Tax=Salinicoccus halitifaciens TaxID=1073415 RepID=A0ABV2E8X8_9STAP|nr:Flp pilus assembly protein CpaB [Salinicoccus halitifaciens]MCD2137993.1 Flp pilus assembly protein CpaB [Salinicoccus halitifaciens]